MYTRFEKLWIKAVMTMLKHSNGERIVGYEGGRPKIQAIEIANEILEAFCGFGEPKAACESKPHGVAASSVETPSDSSFAFSTRKFSDVNDLIAQFLERGSEVRLSIQKQDGDLFLGKIRSFPVESEE